MFLENKKSPSRKVGELDNRGSHFYLALYWAQRLAEQNKDAALKTEFTLIAKNLEENKTTIINELDAVQGKTVSLGGYYKPTENLVVKAMRSSKTFNTILATL